MKVFITGFPGTGKSSVAHELKRRGHNAYDPENMRQYMHLISRVDGRNIHAPHPIPRGWFSTEGRFDCDIPKVMSLMRSHDDIFVCTLADNQEELFGLFDRIFLLTVDDSTLEARLKARAGYGSSAAELAETLMLRANFERSLLAKGAIAVNVECRIPEVVDTILEHCHDN